MNLCNTSYETTATPLLYVAFGRTKFRQKNPRITKDSVLLRYDKWEGVIAIFAIDFWEKINDENGENGKNGEKNVRHFRHDGENGEKIDGKNGKMAKMVRKSMARMAKMDGENGEFFSPFSHGENLK